MPSMLDPYVADIESWFAAEPHLTAIAILGRLNDRAPTEFGPPQHSIIQRLLKTLRIKAAHQLIAGKMDAAALPPQQALQPIPSPLTGNISLRQYGGQSSALKLKKQLDLNSYDEDYSAVYASEKFGGENNKEELQNYISEQQKQMAKLIRKYAYATATNRYCYVCGIIEQYTMIQKIGQQCDEAVKAYDQYKQTENPSRFFCDKLQNNGLIQISLADIENDQLDKKYWEKISSDLKQLKLDIDNDYGNGVEVDVERMSNEKTGLAFFSKQHKNDPASIEERAKAIQALKEDISQKPDCKK
jgi:hypothetical protein